MLFNLVSMLYIVSVDVQESYCTCTWNCEIWEFEVFPRIYVCIYLGIQISMQIVPEIFENTLKKEEVLF